MIMKQNLILMACGLHQTAYSPIINMIQNTADYKEDFLKTLNNNSLSLKTLSDKTRMS